MKNNFLLTYAFRCLGFGRKGNVSHASKSLIGAIIGIGISIIPLVVVLVLSDGMIQGISSRMIELGSGHIRIVKKRVKRSENDGRYEKQLKSQLKKRYSNNPYFVNAWVERQGTGLIIGKEGRSGGTIRAVESNFFDENISASNLITVIDGELTFKNNRTVILGKKIAENLDLHVGDTCIILTLTRNEVGKSIPKTSIFKVGGIVSSGYQELDSLWVFIPLEKGLRIFTGSSSWTSIIVSVQDIFDDQLFHKFYSDIQQYTKLGFNSYTWYNLNESQFISFSTTKNLLIFVMVLIILVASANISSALVMLVLERNKEIAILKATGASSLDITFSFLLAGLMTSIGGVFFGLPLGILVALNINEIFSIIERVINYAVKFLYFFSKNNVDILYIHILDPEYYLEKIPIHLNFIDIFFVILCVLSLSILVCIIPAIKAGRDKPIENMRRI